MQSGCVHVAVATGRLSSPGQIWYVYCILRIYIYLYTPLQHVTNEPSTATGEGPNTRLRHCSASVPSGGWHFGKPLWKFFYPLFGSPQNHTIPSGQIIATSHDLTLKGSYNLARYNSMLGGNWRSYFSNGLVETAINRMGLFKIFLPMALEPIRKSLSLFSGWFGLKSQHATGSFPNIETDQNRSVDFYIGIIGINCDLQFQIQPLKTDSSTTIKKRCHVKKRWKFPSWRVVTSCSIF